MELQEISLTILESNKKIRHLENVLEMLLNRKEMYLSKTQPKATDYSKETVEGGTREDKFLMYVINCDEEDLDNNIDTVQQEIFNLSMYVENESKRIGEWDKIQGKVIHLREKTNMTWEEIALATCYSKRQCIRIYKQYTQKRYFE